MDATTLAPRGEAMTELVRLTQLEQKARARVDEIGREARAAAQEVQDAREALVQLERRAGGGDVTAAQRVKAEKRLTLAEDRAEERWRERRAGAERAAMDARHAIQLHAAKHRDELVAELEQDGRAAAEQVNHAGQAFLDAVQRRAEVDRALTQTVALTRSMRPGDIARARSEEAAHAVAELLQRGGEVPPAVRIDLPVAAA
jgi:hypothetical protein